MYNDFCLRYTQYAAHFHGFGELLSYIKRVREEKSTRPKLPKTVKELDESIKKNPIYSSNYWKSEVIKSEKIVTEEFIEDEDDCKSEDIDASILRLLANKRLSEAQSRIKSTPVDLCQTFYRGKFGNNMFFFFFGTCFGNYEL